MGERDAGESADILLVEDNRGDGRLVVETFADAGLLNSLYTVTDGDEALEFVYQRGGYTDAPRPDVILLDWHLPGTGGEDVLTELKGDADLAAIPIIVLTGSEAHTDQASSYELQANAYLTKPVDTDEFIETICSFTEFWLEIVRRSPTDE